MIENVNEIRRKSSVKLGTILSIYTVGTVMENFRLSLADTEDLEINLAEVKECDTSGIQILCSAKKTANKEGKRLFLEGISKPVEDAMINTGVTRQMVSHNGGIECQK